MAPTSTYDDARNTQTDTVLGTPWIDATAPITQDPLSSAYFALQQYGAQRGDLAFMAALRKARPQMRTTGAPYVAAALGGLLADAGYALRPHIGAIWHSPIVGLLRHELGIKGNDTQSVLQELLATTARLNTSGIDGVSGQEKLLESVADAQVGLQAYRGMVVSIDQIARERHIPEDQVMRALARRAAVYAAGYGSFDAYAARVQKGALKVPETRAAIAKLPVDAITQITDLIDANTLTAVGIPPGLPGEFLASYARDALCFFDHLIVESSALQVRECAAMARTLQPKGR